MKLNLNQEFKALNGEVIKSESGNLTLKSICSEALLNTSPEDKLSGEDKAKRYQLAHNIFNSKAANFEITVEEVALLKNLIGNLFTPLVVGQAFKFLEN
jgi:hypothetical protein